VIEAQPFVLVVTFEFSTQLAQFRQSRLGASRTYARKANGFGPVAVLERRDQVDATLFLSRGLGDRIRDPTCERRSAETTKLC
jgi:hypothetical protein